MLLWGLQSLIKKWFEVSYVENSEQILKSLSQLQQGETWVVGKIENPIPQKIKILEKKTVHPNPKNPTLYTKAIPVDVSDFVYKLNKILEKDDTKEKSVIQESTPKHHAFLPATNIQEISELKAKLRAAENKNRELEDENRELTMLLQQNKEVIDEIRNFVSPFYKIFNYLFNEIPLIKDTSEHTIITSPANSNNLQNPKFEIWLNTFAEKTMTGKMLRAFMKYNELTTVELSAEIKSPIGGSFSQSLSKLTKNKLIKPTSRGRYKLNAEL